MLAVWLQLLGIVIFVLTHITIARTQYVSRPRAVLIALATGLAAVVLVAEALDTPDRPMRRYLLAWSLTYLCLAQCYSQGFYALGESGRRLRLLIELRQAGQRGLNSQELLSRYDGRMIIGLRLRRLMSVGQVIERDGRFVLVRHQMLYLARIINWWGRLTSVTERKRGLA